jgi:hypothetical protein
MRRVASFLLLGVAFAANAATEVWRWKDKDGVIHYSDSPVPGAERVALGSAVPPTGVPARPPAVSADVPPPETQARMRYTRCAVTAPTNDQIYKAGESVGASVAIEPALQAGHRILVYLNGGAYTEWPETDLDHVLNGLYRGSYTLSVRVLDGNDRTVCTGSAINFHVQQPSILSPARKPPKKK